jgi:anthranilate phosphoribosyltransferase
VIIDSIYKLLDRVDLDEAEARSAMEDLMTGQASDAQVASFLTALCMKGETAAELAAFARVMREKAEPFWDGEPRAVLDTCGTGGDRSGTFNISTAAALVVAGAGVPVAKHGNRSASSLCGSADVLEALGVNIEMPIHILRKAVTEVGMGFLFAPRFHRSMKHVMPARTQLKFRTVFNVIGPLANPASPRFQVIGVFSPQRMELVANALLALGTERALVVHGRDGLDEISISAPTDVLEIRDGAIHPSVITPHKFGVSPSEKQALVGGDAKTNAEIIESILKKENGPRRDIVLMNAGAALMISGSASTLVEGFRQAEKSIDSGAAFRRLQQLREMSNEAA